MKRLSPSFRFIIKRRGQTVKRIFCFMLIGSLVLASCNSTSEQSNDQEPINEEEPSQKDEEQVEEPDQQEDEGSEEQIMEEFRSLVSESSSPVIVAEFMDEKMPNVSKENASLMIHEFEQIQFDYLPILEEKYFEDKVQEVIQSDYHSLVKSEQSQDQMEEDGELSELIAETLDGGYKIEMAEGMYFPIINYSFYEKYSSYAAVDYVDYINLMSTESNEVPAKDAALVIDWGELIERAVTQEQFMNDYPESDQVEKVSELYDNYLIFLLYGLNNTPLFEYETDQINEEAKQSYEAAIQANDESETIKIVEDFLQLIEENDGKLTDEVEEYRETYAPTHQNE